jgi:hypothetical protein
VFSKLLERRFPLNMSRSVIETITVLTQFGDAVLQETEIFDRRSLQRRGLPNTYAELSEVLDLLRLRDLEEFKKWQAWRRDRNRGRGKPLEPPAPLPKFTHLFHP